MGLLRQDPARHRMRERFRVRSAFNIADDGGIWSGWNHPPVDLARAGKRPASVSAPVPMVADRGATAPTVVESQVSCPNL